MASALLDQPEGRIDQATQVRGAQHLETRVSRLGKQFRQAVTPVVHKLFVVHVVATRPGRDFEVRDPAGPEDARYFPQRGGVIVDVFEHVERRDGIDARGGQWAAAQVELQQRQTRQAVRQFFERRQDVIGADQRGLRQRRADFLQYEARRTAHVEHYRHGFGTRGQPFRKRAHG